MTMGQRIAERRKMLGLSQEALGEQMGVSRQAISKWEADGAIPEIDKLIALSKLFSVRVGWLLGVEEESAGEPEEKADEGLSEAQLKMVEEIVRRYQQPQPKSKGTMAAVAAAICCAVAALAIALAGWSDANRQFPNYDNQLQNLSSDNSYIQSQLSDLSGRLDELAEGERLLSEYETEVELEPDWNTLDIRFYAVPQQWQEGDAARLSLRQNGREVYGVDCIWDGMTFSASAAVSGESGYESYFILSRADGTQEQQNVSDEVLQYLPDGLTVMLEVSDDNWSWDVDSLEIRDMMLYAAPPWLMETGTEEEPAWERLDLVASCQGTVLARKNLLECENIDDPGAAVKRGSLWLDCGGFDVPLPEARRGESVELYFEAALENGYTFRCPYQNLVATEDGYFDLVEAVTMDPVTIID